MIFSNYTKQVFKTHPPTFFTCLDESQQTIALLPSYEDELPIRTILFL